MNLALEDEIRLLCLVGPLFLLVPWHPRPSVGSVLIRKRTSNSWVHSPLFG